jgi:hypothetical protein
MMKLRIACLLSLACSFSAAADEVVIYRCTDSAGALTLQNAPCPKGHKQEKKVMQSVATVPMGATAPARSPSAPAAKPAPVTPLTPATAPAPATPDSTPPADISTDADTKANKLPPPVLFQCTTYDKDTYITESEEPQSRCVALRTVGLDGNPNTGAGEACEVMRDQCARVPDGALCAAWEKRVGETEVAARYARPGNEDKNQAEFERAKKIYSESSCGK